MYFLLVEDEDPKRFKISSFLSSAVGSSSIEEARSVRSAIDSIRRRKPDLIILDMSLPTFDITDEEPGGRPQGFGGIEVFRYLSKLDLACPTIVVTGYEAFVDEASESIGLEEMDAELRLKFPECYRGIVYFNSLYSDWSEKLLHKLEEVMS